MNSVCRTPACTYDALPVMDGMLWHGGDRAAGRPRRIRRDRTAR